MDQVGFDLMKASGEPDRVGDGQCGVYGRHERTDPLATHIPQPLIEWDDFGRDPAFLQLGAEWTFLAQNHMCVDAFQHRKQPKQRDFSAREFGAMIKVDDPRPYARPTSRG